MMRKLLPRFEPHPINTEFLGMRERSARRARTHGTFGLSRYAR
jgi:hypothetical protein